MRSVAFAFSISIALLACAGCRAIAGVEDISLTNPPCDGVPTDLDADPANCGACGHDCLGGACTAGVCQALEVTSVMPGDDVYGLGLAKGDLFVLGSYIISRCDPDSCDTTTTYPGEAPGNRYITSMTVTPDATIYVGTETNHNSPHTGTIGRTRGGGVQTFVSGLTYPTNVAPQGDKLYYADEGSLDQADGYVAVCDLPDCATSRTLQTAYSPYGVFPMGDELYWIAYDITRPSTPILTLYKCTPSTGCGAATKVTTPDVFAELSGVMTAFDDGFVFTTKTSLVRVDLQGNASPLVTGQKTPDGVSSVGKTLFWSETVTHTIWSLDTSKPHAEPVALWVDDAAPAITIADDAAVYFSLRTGAVSRIAR